jgi:Xaa-Pro dipeptidase
MAVSDTEIGRRCDKIRRLMSAQHLDALLIPSAVTQNDSSSVRYISNHRLKSRREYVVFPAQGDPIYILPRENEKVAAVRHTWIRDIRVASFGEAMPSTAADILRELKADQGEIGIVGMNWVMPYGDFPVLSRKLPKAHFRDASDLMTEARMVKSREEIRLMQEATELADKGYERVLELIGKGKAELDIVGEVFKVWIAGGVERTILLTAAGPNTNGTIDYPSAHIFERDDIYIFSVELAGPSGYWTQIVRPVYLGKVLNEYHECFNVCREAMQLGLKFLKPGNRICEVVRPMHERIKRDGHSVGHWIGHNMGMDVGEPPHLNPDVETLIEEGMVITLHPFAKKDNRGIFTGDTFVVEKDGPRNLSKTKLDFLSC